MAVRFPAVRTPEKVTVKVVAVAAVTVPVTPLLNTTVLLLGVAESKPNPLMVNVAVVSNKLAVLLVTTGTTFATASAVPLVTVLVVTTAVKLPSEVGFVVNRTVSEVAVAAVKSVKPAAIAAVAAAETLSAAAAAAPMVFQSPLVFELD